MSDVAYYLESIDARLVRYLDAEGNLSEAAVRHVRRYALALLQEVVVPEHVHEDWPDFFPLASALVISCRSPRIAELERRSCLFKGWGDDPLTGTDRAFLVALVNAGYERLCSR